MCDPVSLGLAGLAMSATTAIAGGIMQSQQASYAAAAAEQNSQIAQQNAQTALKQGEDDQRTQYQKVAALKGQQIAAFAASGLDVSFGSPMDVIDDTALLGEQDAQKIRDTATARANSFILDASNYRSEAAGDRAAGTAGLVGGFLKAGATALTGASQIPGFGRGPSTKLTSSYANSNPALNGG